jgi:hypothetical protein
MKNMKLGVNEFSDWNDNELKNMNGPTGLDPSGDLIANSSKVSLMTVPEEGLSINPSLS